MIRATLAAVAVTITLLSHGAFGQKASESRAPNSSSSSPSSANETGPASSVAALADLKAERTIPPLILVRGYHTPGDGGGGIFYFMAGDTAPADDILIVDPGAWASGRYRRIFEGPVSVKWAGALGDGKTDDTIAFASAMATACRKKGSTLYVPQAAQSYRISKTLTQCDGLDIECDVGATLHYTGKGALFDIGVSLRPHMRGCTLQGENAPDTYGIRVASSSPTAAIKAVFEQLTITGFGDAATQSGAGILIATDSPVLTVRESILSNYGAGIVTTAPTDTLDVHDNLITSSTGRCIALGHAVGATTMQIRHNSLSCTGGAVLVDTTSGVVYLTDNEQENLPDTMLTDARSAAYSVLTGAVIAINNTCNVHGRNDYCWSIGDRVTNSRFSGNTVNGFRKFGFQLATKDGNIYDYNRTDGLLAKLYSKMASGIVAASASAGVPSYSVGMRDGLGGLSVAMPGVAYDEGDRGQATLVDSADPNRKFSFGYDGTRDVGYVQAVKSLMGSVPLLLNPKGGGVWVYNPVFPGFTGYCFANDTRPATCSAHIPHSAITGLGTASAKPAESFLQSSRNLEDLPDVGAARRNLKAASLEENEFSGTQILKGIAQTYTSPFISAGRLTINLSSGTVFNINNDSDISEFSIVGPSSSKASEFKLVVTSNGGSYSQSWGRSVRWPGNVAPTLTASEGKVDILTFVTSDGGVSWFGIVSGQKF